MAEPGHQTPVIPGLLDEFNVIQYYVRHSCNVPYRAYLEGARPWAAATALALVTPDLTQIVQNMLMPKTLRTGKHARKGHRGKSRYGGIPDVDDMIAKRLPIEPLQGSKIMRSGRRMMLGLAGMVDRVQYELFLGDILDEGLIAPIMGALRFEKGACDNYTYLDRESDPVNWGLPGNQWTAFGFGNWLSGERVYSPNDFIARPLSGDVLAVWGGELVARGFADQQIGIRMIDPDTNMVIAQQGPTTVSPGDSFTFVLSVRVNELRGCTGQVIESGGGFRDTGSMFTMFQIS